MTFLMCNQQVLPHSGIAGFRRDSAENFEGNFLIELGIASLVDLAHSARAEFLQDLVVKEDFTDHSGSLPGLGFLCRGEELGPKRS